MKDKLVSVARYRYFGRGLPVGAGYGHPAVGGRLARLARWHDEHSVRQL